MNKEFNEVLSNYLLEDPNKVDSSSYCYELVCRTLPHLISEYLGRDDLLVQGSVGKGNRTDFPWISILNRNITTTTQQGLYMVFLFKKDMSGFYLSLGHGITYFEKKFGSEKYTMARQMVDYYKTQIDPGSYSFEPIDLGASKNQLAYGYEQATVISVEFYNDQFTEVSIKKAIQEILNQYDEIYIHMQSRSYDDVIDQVLSNEDQFTDVFTAIKQANDVLYEDPASLYDTKRMLVEEVPYAKQSKKYRRLTAPVIRKTDYVKKAKKDALTGLMGETLVMEFEMQRLQNLGLDDYVPEIQQVSEVSDSFGYDLKSYQRDSDGNIEQIYIEVKTTSSKIDTEFFVSINEVNKSNDLNDSFWIYRVYDCYASNPKFYRAQGSIDKNFELDPITFMAKYRFPKELY